MCGIVGIYDKENHFSIDKKYNFVSEMCETLRYRGPDAEGIWISKDGTIALGHRRLSIYDLSLNGNQPMISQSGRYVISLNGSIYNHVFLRKKLSISSQAIRWQSTSDTEVILECIEEFGLEKTLGLLVGMFAFACWDNKKKELVLARDRLGEKPLYFGTHGSLYFFASELKALMSLPFFEPKIDEFALSEFFKYGYIPAPNSIFQNVQKIEPGCYVTISNSPKFKRYWSAETTFLQAKETQSKATESTLLTNLECALQEAVNLQLTADVPIGVFLSGGIDSSLITALMSRQEGSRVNSFSIGFEEQGYDEAPMARAIAEHLGTNHTELYINEQQCQDVMSVLPDIYDEPFADASQIPTFLLCKLSKNTVSVALSGDGGDEFFCGYNRYTWGSKIHSKAKKFPKPFRQLLANQIKRLNPDQLNALLNPLLQSLPLQYQFLSIGDKIQKIGKLLNCRNISEVYESLVTILLPEDKSILLNPIQTKNMAVNSIINSNFTDTESLMLSDISSFLPNSVLTKVDRAAMHVALETRSPFLDHRVIKMAMELPMHMKKRGNIGKYCLREILKTKVPQSLIERPKSGFTPPVGQWLRGPCKDWAESLLGSESIKSQGLLDNDLVQKCWQQHKFGSHNFEAQLWPVIMFRAWSQKYGF